MINHLREDAEVMPEFNPFRPDTDRRFGVWHYRANNHMLTFSTGRTYYEIDLEKIRTSAEILDWIFQIAEKRWATPTVVHDLVLAFCESFGRGICGSGIDKPVKHLSVNSLSVSVDGEEL